MKSMYYVAIFIVWIIDIILYSLFSIYNVPTPSIGGLPFFYVYQIIMLVVTTILYLGAALIKG